MINPYKGSKRYKGYSQYCAECIDDTNKYMCTGIGCEDCLFYFMNAVEFNKWNKKNYRETKLKRILNV